MTVPSPGNRVRRADDSGQVVSDRGPESLHSKVSTARGGGLWNKPKGHELLWERNNN